MVYLRMCVPSHSGLFTSRAYPVIIVCCCQSTMIGENLTVSLCAFLYTLHMKVCVVSIASCRKPSIQARLSDLRLEKFGDKLNEVDATQVCC